MLPLFLFLTLQEIDIRRFATWLRWCQLQEHTELVVTGSPKAAGKFCLPGHSLLSPGLLLTLMTQKNSYPAKHESRGFPQLPSLQKPWDSSLHQTEVWALALAQSLDLMLPLTPPTVGEGGFWIHTHKKHANGASSLSRKVTAHNSIFNILHIHSAKKGLNWVKPELSKLSRPLVSSLWTLLELTLSGLESVSQTGCLTPGTLTYFFINSRDNVHSRGKLPLFLQALCLNSFVESYHFLSKSVRQYKLKVSMQDTISLKKIIAKLMTRT